MQKFSIEATKLPGLTLINPFYSADQRGCFIKIYEKDIFRDFGFDHPMDEVFLTQSTGNVVRGMHFQTHKPQAKLISSIVGYIFDVALDLRKDSVTFGQWQGFILSSDNRKCLYIPKGFAHGYQVLSQESMVSYHCMGNYMGDYDSGIIWNDSELDIHWPIQNPILSERDKNLMTFQMFKDTIGGL